MHEFDLFIVAIEIDDEIARREYLDAACQNAPELRARVERLLDRADSAGDFLEMPAADLFSDIDAGAHTEENEPHLSDGDAPTMIGRLDDTGQSVLVNAPQPGDSKAGVPSSVESDVPAALFGTLFGRYQVERVLGSGGMGVVYLAEDLRLGRRVALKIPKFDDGGKFNLIERFRREARTMASVQHRNLCPIYDVDEQDGTHYLTMAFIDGEPLSQILKRETSDSTGSRSRETSDRTLTSPATSFTARQIAELIRKLALALEKAHRAGIIHRDLKPANVMIDRDGEPILMDFGLAWMAHESDSRVTQSGAIVGTPAYMSPEQAEGEPDQVGAASDIYSLGAMLYELLTGRTIHTGSVTRVLFKLMHHAPVRPSEVRSDVDPKLEAICWKAIARRPEDRFASAAEFAEALANFDNREGEASTELRLTLARSSASASTSQNRIVISDRTEVLSQGADAATIAYSKPQVSSRGRSRIVLASLLLIGAFGAAWTIVAGRVKPAVEKIVQSQPQTPAVDQALAVPEAVGAKVGLILTPRDRLTSSDWVWSVPENLGPATNTAGEENSPHFSADGRRLWFQRGQASSTDRAWICDRESPDKPWMPAKSVGSAFEFKGPMADMFVSRDEMTWLFVSWDRQTPQRLFESTRTSPLADWSNPKPIINAGSPAQFPVLAGDGLTLYFTNGAQGDGLFAMSRPQTTAPWSEPVRLEPPLNSGEGARASWVSADGLVLVFHSVRGNTPKHFDLWLTTRSSPTEPWQEPVSFGPTINTSANEKGACLSNDGRELVFESDRPGGFGATDLYVSRRVPKPDQKFDLARAIAPFGDREAKAHQVAWAEHLGTTVEVTNSVGMKLILIPPGKFLMGSTDEQIATAAKVADEINAEIVTKDRLSKVERPQHPVVITKPFRIGATEVTIAQFKKFSATGYRTEAEKLAKDARSETYLTPGYGVTDESPAAVITWNDAMAYCQWLSDVEKAIYRLPTEAEWEYSCRAGTTTQFSFGDDHQELAHFGWFKDNSELRSHEVGQKRPNAFGLHDIHGNLWEWCHDFYDEKWYEKSPTNDPTGPTFGSQHVIRGGFWPSSASTCRSAHRGRTIAANRSNHFGFRVVLSVDAPR